MSVVLLLGLGIVLFFVFFAFMGRVRKQGRKAMPRAARQLPVRYGSEATRESIASLVQRAGISPEGARPAELVSIVPALGAARGFPGGFWHPENSEAASEVMEACLRDMGLDLLDSGEISREILALEAVSDDRGNEEGQRRKQIAAVVQLANSKLAALDDPRRFRAYAEDLPGWDPAEPAWLLCDAAEHELLLDLDILRVK
jgi:hypothetical protein